MKYSYEFLTKIPPSMRPNYLRKFYKEIMGKSLDLSNPKDYSAKIQWIKLFDCTPIKSQLTDKLGVKEYIKRSFPEIKTAKVYDVANSFDELDFSKCPQQFVIKTNAYCKDSIIISDKDEYLSKDSELSFNMHRKYFDFILSRDFSFNFCFEMQYSGIKRQIFVEEYIHGEDPNHGFMEFKITCFNGEPKFIECFRNEKVAFFDLNWQKLDYEYTDHPKLSYVIEPPKNLQKMIEYAKKLSEQFKLVRVDFYENQGNIYLAEMTFTPFSGFMKYTDSKVDRKIGNMLLIK